MISQAGTGVFRLASSIPEGRYESALVFPIGKRLCDIILKIRRMLPYPAPEEFQLEPHLTILYLGIMSSAALLRLRHELQKLKSQSLQLQCDGFGTFRHGKFVTNLHVRVRHSEPLMALHYRSMEACKRHKWIPPTKRIGSRYVPHITVLDHIKIPTKGFRLPDNALIPSYPIALSGLCQFAKRSCTLD